MRADHIENARIEHVSILKGRDDSMTCFVTVTFASGGQAFGGWDLGDPTMGVRSLFQIMDAVGSETWEGMLGMHCRVRSKTRNGRLVGIGHILNDHWYVVSEETERVEFSAR